VLEVDSTTRRSFDEFDTRSLSIFANILGISLAQRLAEQDTIAAAAEASRSRARSEILLRELQHRVKNNLQVIVSLLAMQRRRATGEEARERIASVIDRVLAIALAHDQLSLKEGGSSVEFNDYLKALCANIDPGRPRMTIEVDADPASIPLDRAVPAGLIVNELVSNSIKYAFGEEGGTIHVVFRLNAAIGEAEITVADDGRGMGPARQGSLGLWLVDSLAAQLGGRVKAAEVAKGTRTTLTFPYSV
jgi:two-component sensor histidine kinase